MRQRVFKQGEHVTWTDASGERQRGHVLQYHPPGFDTGGSKRDEEVLVVREGTAHVTAVPPAALARSTVREPDPRP